MAKKRKKRIRKPAKSRIYWLHERKKSLDVRALLQRKLLYPQFVSFIFCFSAFTSDCYLSVQSLWEAIARANDAKVVPLSKATVYNYLRDLHVIGMVRVRYDGRRAFFRYDQEAARKYKKEIREALVRQGIIHPRRRAASRY